MANKDKTVEVTTVGEDLKTNRNSKMIQTLMHPRVNGLFLYFIEGNEEVVMMPPGLEKEEIAKFKREFSHLFEQYAKIANERIRNNKKN